ncbi:MAG: ribonuclease HII [Gammaproteobacteria bacterium]|nr:ribonuclease HII [Gammaproteobacteria bacterium]
MIEPTNLLAGIDEVGRGALAGPVVAAAVILPPNSHIPGLKDSKALSRKQRHELAAIIYQEALCFAIAQASHAEIDQMNILQASLLAMQRAITSLSVQPTEISVDGLYLPKVNIKGQAIVKGDSLVPAISAASILAKEWRDHYCETEMHTQYPNYQFFRHKAYPTPLHLQLLQKYGPCPLHRMTYAPLKTVAPLATRLGELSKYKA